VVRAFLSGTILWLVFGSAIAGICWLLTGNLSTALFVGGASVAVIGGLWGLGSMGSPGVPLFSTQLTALNGLVYGLAGRARPTKSTAPRPLVVASAVTAGCLLVELSAI
jgi:hypothetical protein